MATWLLEKSYFQYISVSRFFVSIIKYIGKSFWGVPLEKKIYQEKYVILMNFSIEATIFGIGLARN